MALFSNHYECPCGNRWEDQWDCTCDDRCPVCSTSCSPSFSYDLNNPEEVNEMYYNKETLEEHTARIKKISDEIKADIKAGRYRHGQVHTHIRGSYAYKSSPTDHITRDLPKDILDKSFLIQSFIDHEKSDFQKTIMDSYFSPAMKMMDWSHYRRAKTFWPKPEPEEKDWERKTFKSGPATTPDEATRLKLRIERNRKRGRK